MNVLFENPEEMGPQSALYLSEFYNRREDEVIWGFTESLRSRRGVLTFDAGMKVERQAYYRHDYYNLIMRPAGLDQTLKAIIDERGPALGAVVLQRAPGDADFVASDSICLGSIIPYLAHALAAPPPELEAPLVDGEDEGLFGITIKRQEPLPLKLLRQLEQLPALSRRQMQVCLMLAAGHSRPAIAKRLDIGEHTAITYTRQVYDKLQVHNRGELLVKLMGM